MAFTFPPDLAPLVDGQMATGKYPSEEDLLREALQALVDRNEGIAAIAEGIADMEAGRVRPFTEVVNEIRAKHGFAVE